MDDTVGNKLQANSNEKDQESSSKDTGGDERNSIELTRSSNDSNCWWPRENAGEKLNSQQRWSFGSDLSAEAVESLQNRLCCSPVDEFDSTISSENEDLIVNNTDEADESYKNYIQVSPPASPDFKENIACSDNKKQNKDHDVDTADDELIDYSKRYTTDSSMSTQRQQQQRNIAVNRVTRHVPEKKSANNRSKVDPFGDYAETDLDQPTDYSLRYAEEDTDEEETENPRFYCTSEQEDTVKSYYTEGTPYQTPCNFSNATSMSDLLLLEDNKESEEAAYRRQFLKEQKQETTEKSEKNVKDCKHRIRRKFVSEDSKIPVLKETPESCDNQQSDRKLGKLSNLPQSPTQPCDKDKENKAATLNVEENNYAQETPLMFSRSSSLDSLSDFEQHSIHDDRSSVISDFSHRTSGVVSPSELPDSPTQTVPPSPRKIKQENTQNLPPPRLQSTRPPLRKPPEQQRHHSENKLHSMSGILRESNHREPVNSVFEDGLVSFKEESMPRKALSTTGSILSALTIDDEQEEICDNREIINRIASIRVRTSAAGMHRALMQKQNHNDSFEELETNNKPSRQQCQSNNALNRPTAFINNCLLVRSPKEEVRFVNIEEEQNDYMPTYLNKDHHNNSYCESLKDPWYDDNLKTDSRNYSNRQLLRSPEMKRNNDVASNQKLDLDEIIALDTMRIYCTEDTPTYVSPYGSQSNLSALSVLSISDEDNFYGADFNPEREQCRRSFYRTERSSSPVDDYNSEASSSFSEEDDRRIDVSPFDSQMNLNGFSLLSIVEESEEEYEEASNETDKSARDDSCAEDEDANAYQRLSYENSDFSDEDQRVLEEFIKLGVSKVTQRGDDPTVDEQRRLF